MLLYYLIMSISSGYQANHDVLTGTENDVYIYIEMKRTLSCMRELIHRKKMIS